MTEVKEQFMKTHVYYGEYTLRHWLNLMLTRNIDLPEYQRSFVWEEEDVKRLVESLRSGQFILPVTIAHYQDEEGTKNLILDGQQRLTSLLLAYLGYMPIKEMFKASEDDLAHGDDSRVEEQNTTMEWTYKFLLKDKPQENTIEKIQAWLKDNDHYSPMTLNFDENIDDFYDKMFLGFSFIIPSSTEAKETQRYFSTLFRNMNYLGKKLSPLESRRSLYFMNKDYKNYFDGRLETGEDVLCGIRIVENMQPKKIDFVRYLSVLSQYMVVRRHEITKVLLGYSAYSWRESYYADYVSYIVHLEQESRKDKFDGFDMERVFPNQEWRERFVTVHSFLERNKRKLGLDEKFHDSFTSWIDADYWLYGLLYHVVFQGESITNEQGLIEEMRREIHRKRWQRENGILTEYQRNPNRLGNLRERIVRSIEIYGNYAK